MFPDEIYELILLELNYEQLINICSTIKYFDDLCKKNNTIEKRKMKGFPNSISCNIYDICELDTIDLYSKLMDVVYGMSYVDHDTSLMIPLLDDVLTKLYKLNINLVYGDLINFGGIHNCCFLFDGSTILHEHWIQYIKDIPSDFILKSPTNYYKIIDGYMDEMLMNII